MAHAPQVEKPGVLGWIEYRLPIFSLLNSSLVEYPTPRNLNYAWNFGSIAGIMLVSQILTGIFLAMHYAANTGLAFDSVEHIMRDVNYGWLMRYLHAVGASMFFMVTYIHIFRGLYYGSYKRPRELLWWLGIVILLLMMATAFIGYVLPWGQMSFWGATVITSLFSAFPVVGEWIVTLLWGGFSVDDPTLNRFFALHFLLPFVLIGVVVLHLVALHQHGSNNPTGLDATGPQDKIPFHPYYTVKDFFGFGVFFLIFAAFVFFAPNYLGHPDNYIPANPLVTPAHIVPEWYFLPFYAILRAIVFDIPLWLPGLAVIGLAVKLRYVDTVRALVQGSKFLTVLASFLPKKSIGFGLFSGLLSLGLIMTASGLLGGFIPSKLAGVLAMFGSILVLFALPWLDTSPVRSANYRPVYKIAYWIFAVVCIALGFLGAATPDGCNFGTAEKCGHLWSAGNADIALAMTAYYFAHFLVLMPLIGKMEKPLPLPKSIGEAVTTLAHH
ncbi:MAG: cytochrome bc complex cytochrome b subunit [Rickettsiales bacterium]